MYNTQQMCAFDVSLETLTFCLIHVTYARRLRHIRFYLSYLPILFQWLNWFWCVHQHSIRLVWLFVLARRIDISRFAVRFFFQTRMTNSSEFDASAFNRMNEWSIFVRFFLWTRLIFDIWIEILKFIQFSTNIWRPDVINSIWWCTEVL